MFGGFGGFGGQDPNKNQTSAGFGFPGMSMNANVTTTHTTSSASTGGFGGMSTHASFGAPTHTSHTTTTTSGGGDPSKKGSEMQDRYRNRQDKLPRYTALVDVLEIKGENVYEMRVCITGATMTAEEMKQGMEVFEKVASAAMSFDFMKMMQ